MNEKEVVDLMRSSRSADDWNHNCDVVKKSWGGYPSFWFAAIVISGVMADTARGWK